MFRGSIVAIVTPFRDGKIDEKAFRDLIEFQINNGTDGIVPCGTTGESATLSHEEHERVVEIVVDEARRCGASSGRVGGSPGGRPPTERPSPPRTPSSRRRTVLSATTRPWPRRSVTFRSFSTMSPAGPRS